MLWFFTREQQSLTVETRYDNVTDEYVATLIGATVAPELVRFKTAEACRLWLAALERNVLADGWNPEGAPHVLPDDWPHKAPPK